MWSTRKNVLLKRKIEAVLAVLILAAIGLSVFLLAGIDYQLTYNTDASGSAEELIFQPGSWAKLSAEYNFTVYLHKPLLIVSLERDINLVLNTTVYTVIVVNPSTEKVNVKFSGPVKIIDCSYVEEVHTVSLIKSALVLDIFMFIFVYILNRMIANE